MWIESRLARSLVVKAAAIRRRRDNLSVEIGMANRDISHAEHRLAQMQQRDKSKTVSAIREKNASFRTALDEFAKQHGLTISVVQEGGHPLADGTAYYYLTANLSTTCPYKADARTAARYAQALEERDAQVQRRNELCAEYYQLGKDPLLITIDEICEKNVRVRNALENLSREMSDYIVVEQEP